MEMAFRRLACGRCGAEFSCERHNPAGCWCAAETYRLPMPLPTEAGTFDDCLCPSCLRLVAEMLVRAATSVA
ncbi:MAG: cysteine-rich CWC family protein [Hyphomicrobiales bacterium]|nr:cysteine-rich CWC family protein [Hyphomicrobiales bacterium]